MSKIYFHALKEYIERSEESGTEFDPYWIIIWFGRSTWDRSRKITWKEVVLLNVKNITHSDITSKKRTNDLIIDLLIEEHNTREIPLGSILNKTGRVVRQPIPEKNRKGLYAFYSKNYIVNPSKLDLITKNRFGLTIYDILNRTYYPLHSKNELYSECPFYEILFTLEDERSVTFYIPAHVILQSIYYLSNLSTEKLLNDKHILEYIYREGDFLKYSSNKLGKEYSELIGNFFFTKNEYGKKWLKYLKEAHLVEWKNQLDKNGSIGFTFIATEIPFNFDCKLEFTGVYLNEKEKTINNKDTCILVYNISHIVPSDKRNNLFENYDCIDENDKTTTKERENKEAISYHPKIHADLDKKSEKLYTEASNNPTNSTLKHEKTISGLPLPFKLPEVKKIYRTDQMNRYVSDGGIHSDYKGFSINIDEQISDSQYNKVAIKVYKKAADINEVKVTQCIRELLNRNHNIDSEFIILNDTSNEPITRLTNFYENYNFEMLILGIKYNTNYYILINTLDKRRLGFIVGKEVDKRKIMNLLHEIHTENGMNWSEIYHSKDKKKRYQNTYGFDILRPFNHKLIENIDINYLAEEYCCKIHKTIKTHYSESNAYF